MKTTFLDKTRYLLLILLVAMITVSSHPTIVTMSHAAGLERGTILSHYIVFVFGALFVVCFNFNSMLKPHFVRVCWLLYVAIAFFFLITLAFFGSKSMMSDVRSIAISLVAVMIGWQMALDEKRYHQLLLFYAGMTLFVGLMQVMTNIGGFTILDQYHTDNKNALGVMLSTAAIIFLFLGMNKGGKGIVKMLIIGLFLVTMVVLLTIRARSATVATVLMLLYIFYERFKGRNFVPYVVIGLVFLIVVFIVMPQSAKDFVYNSFFQNYEVGDVTAGRSQRNEFGLHFLTQHIFLGNLNQHVQTATIHNYLLNRAFEFGVVFVFPVVLIYFYILFCAIGNAVKRGNSNNSNIGYYLLLIPFIISMAEYTFPYGPGTATVFNFLVFGLSLRYANDSGTMPLSNETVFSEKHDI